MSGLATQAGMMRGSGGFDPEAGLVLTDSFPAGELTLESVHRSSDAVFAMDLTFPTPSTNLGDYGLLMECGGTALGSSIAVRIDGSFAIRWGYGSYSAPTSSQTGMPVIWLAAPPTGRGTLVVDIAISTGNARAWWNGELIGSVTGGTLTEWAGSNPHSYMADRASVQPVGEPATGLTPGDESNLRFYHAQLVNA